MRAFKLIFTNPKYFAAVLFFLSLSLFYSAWITYIPYYCEKLKLSEGALGFALLFSALGSFVMIFASNWIIIKIGEGRATFWAMCFLGISLYFPSFSTEFFHFCIGLFFLGVGTSFLNISMNSMVGLMENMDKGRVMSTIHGFYSVGSMVGASVGSLLAARQINPGIYISLLCLIFIVAQLLLRSSYYHLKSSSEGKLTTSFSLRGVGVLVPIALVGLVVMVSEGAMADWGALYLQREVKVVAEGYSLGYALFALAMAFGRFTGDWFSMRLKPWSIVALGTAIGMSGLFLLLTLSVVMVYLGFFLVGLGFSVIVPEIFRVASKTNGVKTSIGVSFIAGVANLGFLVGPVFLGFLAEMYSIRASFVVLFILIAFAFTFAMYKRKDV